MMKKIPPIRAGFFVLGSLFSNPIRAKTSQVAARGHWAQLPFGRCIALYRRIACRLWLDILLVRIVATWRGRGVGARRRSHDWHSVAHIWRIGTW